MDRFEKLLLKFFISIFVIGALLILFSSMANAQPRYVPRSIPTCTLIRSEDSDQFCGFTFEQMKQIYEIDSEYDKLKKLLPLEKERSTIRAEIIDRLSEQLKLTYDNYRAVGKRNAELTKALIEKDLCCEEGKVKPLWGHWVSWTLVAVLAAGFGGYVIADQLSD